MSLPKEPRQKMINIMYLVLTALLALNVSAEILNAFKTVDRSLVTATNIAEQKNVDLFKSFQRKIGDEKTKEKALQWFPKAEKAKKLADDINAYIDELKLELKKESGLKKIDGKDEFKEDDLEAATRLFVSNPPEGKGKGKEFYEKLINFKKQLFDIDSATIGKEIIPGIPLDLSIPQSNNTKGKNEAENWALNYFHMTPTIAAITILSKFQNDIKNSEAQVVEYCHKKIGEVEIIYDEFIPFAQSNTQYAMPGEELVITAGIGAFSKAARPTISVDGTNVPLKPDGSAEYKTIISSGAGNFSKKIKISFTRPDGTTSFTEKDVKYTVGVPSGLAISTDKTRVFYQGLENPLSIIGGGGDEKINVSISGAGVSSTKAGPGVYTVKCEQLGTATVVASDGKNSQKITIPIKKVPDPQAQVGGQVGGPMDANKFRVQKGVAAVLKDFVFEGVKYDVVAYTVIFTGKGFEEIQVAENQGAYFGAEAQGYIRRCQAGSTIIIDEIKVVGPGGTRKLEGNLSFTLQ